MTDTRILDIEEAAFTATGIEAFVSEDRARLAKEHFLSCFRWHRFFVFNWLMMNGVLIPAELMRDELHSPIKPPGATP